MFKVVATGTASLAYQWLLDEEAVPGATGAILTLGAVQEADAGRCHVVVPNIAVSVLSGAAQLTLNTPPSILTQPVSVMANPGGAVRFGVVAAGTAPLAYQWCKDESSLAGATGSTFALAAAQLSDGGAYNVAGNVASSHATLTVVEPATLTAQRQPLTVLSGQAVSFNVTAVGTAPLL